MSDMRTPQSDPSRIGYGGAISTVKGAGAIEVGRDRFFPVKTTNDLFALRSDLYRLNESKVLEPWTRPPPSTSIPSTIKR